MADRAGPNGDRAILHVDMDAFFASVEVLDRPDLSGKPVVVGGAGPRGVVAACTYEARMFGVRSAMPSVVARRLCPGAVFVDGRFRRYVEVSRQLHTVFERTTPLVEGISLDEAFLDVTGSMGLLGPAPDIAERIRGEVLQQLGLHCSVGIGRSKLIAKLASKAAKPRADRSGVHPGPGVVAVAPADEPAFLRPLPVGALWGVGPATAARLDRMGVRTVGELADLPTRFLERQLGRAHGARLSALARGDDQRPVVPLHDPKSIGHEETFPVDVSDSVSLHRHLARLADASANQLRRAGLAARTVTVKVRFSDFSTVTRSQTVPMDLEATRSIEVLAGSLLDSVDRLAGVRLLGVSLSGLGEPSTSTQLAFPIGSAGSFPSSGDTGGSGDRSSVASPGRRSGDAELLQRSWAELTAAVDGIRHRYGQGAVGHASLLDEGGLAHRERGESQWGPGRPAPSPPPAPSQSQSQSPAAECPTPDPAERP